MTKSINQIEALLKIVDAVPKLKECEPGRGRLF